MSESPSRPLAVLSDIHANLAAFTAVLEDMDAMGAGEAVCLGDVVGYGPDPQACVDLIRERSIPCVLGNHEKGLRSKECPMDMNPVARDTLNRTACMLDEPSAAFLRSLPRSREARGCLLVHGAPPDDPSTYLHKFDPRGLRNLFYRFDQRICFAGHTHDLMLHAFDGEKVRSSALKKGRIALDPGQRHIINAGSVGQPRDGDNRAKYLLFDSEAMTLDVRFVAYDIQATVDKLERLGFSKSLSVRLWG